MKKKEQKHTVTLETSSMFFEDLLFCATRYAFGRHTAMAVGMPTDIANEFYDKMDDKQRKFFAFNCRDVLLNNHLHCLFNLNFDGTVYQAEREGSSILNMLLDDLSKTNQINKIPFIKSIRVYKDSYSAKEIKFEYEFDNNNRFEFSSMSFDDILCWNDLFNMFAGNTVTVLCDSGSVQQEEECVESYVRTYNQDSTVTYEKVYRPIERPFRLNRYVEPSFIIGIKYKED